MVKRLSSTDQNSRPLTNVPTPSAGTDAANKNYADTKEPAITAGTTSQYYRGDKTWQTHDKASVGLANVDNTTDANKNVLSAGGLRSATTTVATTSATAPTAGQVLTATSSTAATWQTPSAGGTNATNLSTSRDGTSVAINSDTGTDVTIAAADTTNAGVMTAADKTKLNGIAAGAQVNPTNYMTTDSTQTIASTAAKTFQAGALIMTSASGTGEPYSDANPPQTLNLSDQASAPANPPAGQSTLYTTAGKNLTLRDSDGTEVAFATRSEAVIRVVHGTTASTTRPAGATYVEWVGSVTPTNANTATDTWIDTA